jgi:hypothetical protein
MFILNLLLLLIAAYFAREEYNNGKIGLAMFWSMLVGWDFSMVLHSI